MIARFVMAFASGANALLSIFPPLVWAVLLAVALLHSCAVGTQRDKLAASATEMKAAIRAQKALATEKLNEATARAAALESDLKQALKLQENTDAHNLRTIADLRKRAAGVRLRDPWAGRRDSGGCPASEGPAAADDRSGDAADATRVLSPELAGLLFDRLEAADRINAAYASCRADSVRLRERMASIGSCLPPEPEAANRPAR